MDLATTMSAPFVRETSVRGGRGTAVYMGDPDGPMRFIKSLGIEVPTYISPRPDLKTQYRSAEAFVSIDYHVPPHMRGTYKPTELADYDPDKPYPLTRTNNVRCGGLKPDGQICQKSAMHRTGFCPNHGGALHPADKMFSSERGIMPTSGTAQLSRLQMVEMGIIPISELTDDEIARQQVHEADGTFSKKSPMLNAKLVAQMRAEFFERADRLVRQQTLPLIEEMQRIALSTVEEAKDKIAAITWLTERALGKTPDVLITNKTDAPFEQLMGDITGGSREDYRNRTAINDPMTIDGQVVIDDEDEDSDLFGSIQALGQTADTSVSEPTQALRRQSQANGLGQDGNEYRRQLRPEGQIDGSTQNELRTAAGVQHAGPTGLSFPTTQGGGGDGSNDNAINRAAEKKAAKDRIKQARNRRYAARARGLDSIVNLPYEVVFKESVLKNGDKRTRMKLIAPEQQKAR